jgi:hypothetical protein
MNEQPEIGGDDRFFLSADVDDDALDSVLAEMIPAEPLSRNSEEEPLAEIFAELTGDADWAASFSRDLAQLDNGGSTGLLSRDEYRLLLRSLAAANGAKGFSLDELYGVLCWANNVRIGQSLLDMTLDGKMLVTLDNGAPSFMPADSPA